MAIKWDVERSVLAGLLLLIRVGLPQWGQRLDDRQVAQITLNIADLLRRFEPRIRTVPEG